jgi:hypothetical protein
VEKMLKEAHILQIDWKKTPPENFKISAACLAGNINIDRKYKYGANGEI